MNSRATLAEQAYASDLKSDEITSHEGSIPSGGTIIQVKMKKTGIVWNFRGEVYIEVGEFMFVIYHVYKDQGIIDMFWTEEVEYLRGVNEQ